MSDRMVISHLGDRQQRHYDNDKRKYMSMVMSKSKHLAIYAFEILTPEFLKFGG